MPKIMFVSMTFGTGNRRKNRLRCQCYRTHRMEQHVNDLPMNKMDDGQLATVVDAYLYNARAIGIANSSRLSTVDHNTQGK